MMAREITQRGRGMDHAYRDSDTRWYTNGRISCGPRVPDRSARLARIVRWAKKVRGFVPIRSMREPF